MIASDETKILTTKNIKFNPLFHTPLKNHIFGNFFSESSRNNLKLFSVKKKFYFQKF